MPQAVNYVMAATTQGAKLCGLGQGDLHAIAELQAANLQATFTSKTVGVEAFNPLFKAHAPAPELRSLQSTYGITFHAWAPMARFSATDTCTLLNCCAGMALTIGSGINPAYLAMSPCESPITAIPNNYKHNDIATSRRCIPDASNKIS